MKAEFDYYTIAQVLLSGNDRDAAKGFIASIAAKMQPWQIVKLCQEVVSRTADVHKASMTLTVLANVVMEQEGTNPSREVVMRTPAGHELTVDVAILQHARQVRVNIARYEKDVGTMVLPLGEQP